MRAASAGKSVIEAGCVREHGSLLMSSGNWGQLSLPVADHSARHCLPSLKRVSYPAPQLSVTAVGTMFVSSTKDSRTTLLIAP